LTNNIKQANPQIKIIWGTEEYMMGSHDSPDSNNTLNTSVLRELESKEKSYLDKLSKI